ncbi:BON domain-containing protein [Halopseudomonas salegens]|uniref:Osmotically-inducible protein OsmY, contains BON domain n=1 Tax=Halopseudomonas salegens TaxID=1434072 RepID=A0A1H2HF22_9GAMM|nr:BON domain-containing protein [Halopseudomonas salegens]SDU30396.1 Osmotically-inducible protein OsmY, contains BON domain [Halopseudomonas salegens]
MNKHPRHFFKVSALALALATSSIAVIADTTTQGLNDARQETRISTTYELNPYLRDHNLQVTVEDGKATLTGNVTDDVNKALAKEIAQGVEGINSVENNIVVDANHRSAERNNAERGFGERIEDASISAAVKAKLMWSKNAEGLATDVATKNRRVTLSGTANSEADSELAERLAANTRNVVSVDNQLRVEGAANQPQDDRTHKDDQSVMAEAGESISDGWITTKVKSTLLYSSNVSGTDIEVSTDNGVVSLKGVVGSGSEHALAVELAQNVRGVKSVQANELSY